MGEQKKPSAWGPLEIIVVAVLVLAFGSFEIWQGPKWYMPKFPDGFRNSQAHVCINNLRQIDAAAYQFALETGKTNGQPIDFPSDLTPYIKLNSAGKIPPCPSGGNYSLKAVGDTPTCSLGTTVTPAHVFP